MLNTFLKRLKISSLLLIGAFIVVTPILPTNSYAMTKEERAAKKAEKAAERAKKKQERKDKRALESIKKDIIKIDKFVASNRFAKPRKALEHANKKINQMSDEFKKTPEAKKILDILATKEKFINDSEQAFKDGRKNEKKLYELGSYFVGFTEKNSNANILAVLINAKNGKMSSSDSIIKEVKANWPKFKAGEKDFLAKFDLLIKQKPNYKSGSRVSLSQVLDVFKNGDKYVASLDGLSIEVEVDEMLKYIAETKDYVVRLHVLKNYWTNYIYVDNDLSFGLLAKAKKNGSDTKAINKVIAAGKDLKKAIESNLKKQSYNKKKYTNSPSSELEKALEKAAKKQGLEVLSFKVEEGWTIIKNAFGIPKYKTIHGYVFLQKEGEPFVRGEDIGFRSDFDGQNKYLTPRASILDGFGIYEK